MNLQMSGMLRHVEIHDIRQKFLGLFQAHKKSQINFNTHSAGIPKCENMSKRDKPLCLGIKETTDYSYRSSTDIFT
jgi:hypothetical protein